MTLLEEMQENYREVHARIYDAGYRYQNTNAARRRQAVREQLRAFAAQIEALAKERATRLAEDATRRRLKVIHKADILFGRVEPGPGDRPTMTRILAEVALKHGVPVEEILSERRWRRVVLARHEVMYRCRKETLFSIPRIGRFLRRDHTTVLHGARAHAERLGENG